MGLEDYFDKGLALIIADIFSLVTISSCLILKVPQIRTLIKNQSATGISVIGLCLELFSYTVMMSYNYTNRYSFISYMEYPILLIQEYVLIFLVFKYNDLLGQKSLFSMMGYVIASILVIFRLMPIFILAFFVPFCTPIGATSKILQFIEIVRTKNSEAVSLMTWALSAFTNFTRIYTVYVESRDLMLLTNFIISFSLSMSVFFAALFYKKTKPKTA